MTSEITLKELKRRYHCLSCKPWLMVNLMRGVESAYDCHSGKSNYYEVYTDSCYALCTGWGRLPGVNIDHIIAKYNDMAKEDGSDAAHLREAFWEEASRFYVAYCEEKRGREESKRREREIGKRKEFAKWAESLSEAGWRAMREWVEE